MYARINKLTIPKFILKDVMPDVGIYHNFLHVDSKE